MKKLLCTIGLLFPMVSFACMSHHVTYTEAYIRAMAPEQTSTAAYMIIENKSDKPITIVGVASEDAATVMMHKTVEKKGRARMEHLHELVVPAHGKLILQPGGEHLMLMGMPEPLVPTDNVTLIITYSDKSTSTVQNIPVKDMRRHE